jgi:hypothetical protein
MPVASRMPREMKLRPIPPATISSSAGGTEFRVNAYGSQSKLCTYYLHYITSKKEEITLHTFLSLDIMRNDINFIDQIA